MSDDSSRFSPLGELEILNNRLADILYHLNMSQSIYFRYLRDNDVWGSSDVNTTALRKLWDSLCDCKDNLSVLTEHVNKRRRGE